ncbi:MAG TPA: hypothetical protein GXX75_21285 [Clostridiales bacterium]|nr:hypothetical protein [Clostridiales bacterium]
MKSENGSFLKVCQAFFWIEKKINPAEVDAINRLVIVGASGMGALTFQPESSLSLERSELSLDEIVAECQKIFESNNSDNLDELFRMGGNLKSGRCSGLCALTFFLIIGMTSLLHILQLCSKGNLGLSQGNLEKRRTIKQAWNVSGLFKNERNVWQCGPLPDIPFLWF